LVERTDEKCELCGKEMVIKWGRYGRFLACSGYPDCKNIKSLNHKKTEAVDDNCPKCGAQLMKKEGRFGEFLACGLPVIINFGFGDCDEIALKEDVGVAINEFSEKEYERQILKLKGLLSEGDALRQRCREIAERYFSLDMGVNRYFDIYSLLNK